MSALQFEHFSWVTRLKTLILLLSLFFAFTCANAQEPLSRDEALGQLYQHYDDTNRTAQWVCPNDRTKDDPCWDGEDAKISIAPLLIAEVNEDGIERTYVVASAEPSNKDRWECHVCGPAIGVAVFAMKSGQWILQCKNAATGFFGSFGQPGDVNLVAVGPHRHGVMLSADFGGQGYYESTETLLLPIGANITQVWSEKVKLDDEGDDGGVERKISNRLRYTSFSGISFYWIGGPDGSLRHDYYDIATISHRSSYRIRTRWTKEEYWHDTYRFDGNKYIRNSHEKLADKPPPRKRH